MLGRIKHKLKIIFPFEKIKFKKAIYNSNEIKLVVGAGGTNFNGWISAEQYVFDITDPADWERYFKNNSISNILAEHVIEHIEPSQVIQILAEAKKYLKKGGVFRIAVPDRNHPSGYVRDLTGVNGSEPGADDHKYFYSINDFIELAQNIGYDLNPIEYFNESGIFISKNFDEKNGYIHRSSKNYRGRFTDNPEEMSRLLESTPIECRGQFQGGGISYTSLLADFTKKI